MVQPRTVRAAFTFSNFVLNFSDRMSVLCRREGYQLDILSTFEGETDGPWRIVFFAPSAAEFILPFLKEGFDVDSVNIAVI
ncbi:uncharacterized protein BT62DRAFT_459285 [Guyanagaster necrorhizus]|uniref:Uncharacterized protein n=1 Tax=Guyanagaster necrorhizus TaxID=856835 RepID=A0A9P7VJY0_9AGAR|nr:uncharacterized protein BT62DRAFT_459285 [Guyanagaster necrorhizus MCA 3950]KAG7441910.1 hypothetical protein BT62DRAFT_459285 [Guyanagaster necrorhizus MCA 3950]